MSHAENSKAIIESELSDFVMDAGAAALGEYQQWKADKKFPRPTLVSHIYAKMRAAVLLTGGRDV